MRPKRWQGPACHYRWQGPLINDLEPAAWHEAGHTVMRWLRLPDTLGTTCMHPDGPGCSDTSTPGESIWAEDALLIRMAGPLAECGWMGTFDFQ